jgi:DNA-binding PadR family transcriptional regulator
MRNHTDPRFARFPQHDHSDRHDHAPHHHGPFDRGQGGPGAGFPGFPGFPAAPGFPPFGPRGGRGGRGRASRGDIRSAILSLLSTGPSNGYGIIKAVAEKTEGLWRPSPGSVYPTLQQLVDEELISSRGEGRGTEFELTDAGRAYVAEHEDELAKAWDSTPSPSEAHRALGESIGKLMGVVGQFHHSATDAQRAAAVEKLDETRKALYLILAE